MAQRRRKRRVSLHKLTTPGASPGTLVADPAAHATSVRLLAYGPDGVDELACDDIARLPAIIAKHSVTWVDVDGLGDVGALAKLGETLGMHPLALEDVLNLNQRPKLEQYDNNVFAVVRMASCGERIESEQLALFLGPGFVASFQGQRPGDCLEPVRERIRRNARIRNQGADFLFYALIDATVDGYFPALDQVGDQIELLEEQIVGMKRADAPSRIQAHKQDLLMLRRWLVPTRDLLNALIRGDYPTISAGTAVYIRDCYDHAAFLLDAVVTYREMVGDLTELYVSTISNRMNEVMKVLTLVATIFIPLTFIVGVYGMNFDTRVSKWNMPELEWAYGYPAVMLFMLAVAIGLLVFFRRKGWLERAS
jgi:magnesium transporter